MHTNAQLQEVKQINNMLSIDGQEDIQLVIKVTGVSVHVINMETLEKSIVVNSKLRNAGIVGQYQGTIEDLHNNVLLDNVEQVEETVETTRQTLATDKNNKTWIITTDGYMIDTVSGIKTELDHKLFESKTAQATIKGNWIELEDISIIDNDSMEYVTEGTAIFTFDNKEYAKDFLILLDADTNEPILIKYDDQNASMNIGVNNTFATYLNTIDETTKDELLVRLGYTAVGENTYVSNNHILTMGEYCTVKEIIEQREVSIKSKLSSLGEKMKAKADKELLKSIGA